MRSLKKTADHNAQIFAYCTLCLGFSLISTSFNFYYVKVFLNFYHIEEKWFQTAQILFMIWNAINDPLFAYYQDNYQTRFTRTRRHTILYGAPLFALSFLLPWFSWGTSPALVGLHLIVTLFFWDTMFTFIGLSLCALFSEISEDENDRYKITRFSVVGSLIGSSSTLIFEYTSTSLRNFENFQITAICVALCSWLCMYYCGKNCHTKYDLQQLKNDRQNSKDEVDHSKKPTESYCRQTCQILSDRNFLSFVITNFFQEFHIAFLRNFMAIICDQLISTELVPLWIRSSFYGSTSMLTYIMLILFMPWISRFSYFHVIRASFAWKIISGTTMFLIGQNQPWCLMVFLLLERWIDGAHMSSIDPYRPLVSFSCFAIGAYNLFNMPLSDVAENNMQRYNRKHPISSMVFGTNALIIKPAISLSPMLVVSVLNHFGYDRIKKNNSSAGLSASELDNLKRIMFLLICFYSVTIGLIQLTLWSFYTIRDRKKMVVIYVDGQEC